MSLALLSTGIAVTASERLSLNEALMAPLTLSQEEVKQSATTSTENEVAAVETKTEQRWVCKGCSSVENRVLKALQDRGITDRNALAVIMGNIQQESRFQTNICEGGAKTGYYGCHRGGFGLIQWTTKGRYNGLGATARGLKMDPNSIDAQLEWMFREREWKLVENRFKTPGQSVNYYMNAAYRWLGWGIHGARTAYANQYVSYLHSQ